ncbi:MAG: DUF3344 domain-containing protein [bacterium]|nr:DUF3344 domain-containing protein [bacterium]
MCSKSRKISWITLLIITGTFLIASISVIATARAAAPPMIRTGATDDLTGDHPLTTSFVWQGHGGIIVRPVTFDDVRPRGIFLVDSIPDGSTIAYACFATTAWQEEYTAASSRFDGMLMPDVQPCVYDQDTNYYLSFYKWNVTPLVTGNGNYRFEGLNLQYCYGVFLWIIYENANLPLTRIVVNDGAESLRDANSTTNFNGFGPGPGTVSMFTQASDSSGMYEMVRFNQDTLAGPGDVFHGNIGYWADYLEFGLPQIQAGNSLTITTDEDWFGIHLAVMTGTPGGQADIVVSLVPIGGIPVIPAQGGAFNFQCSVINHGNAVTAFSIWSAPALSEFDLVRSNLWTFHSLPPSGNKRLTGSSSADSGERSRRQLPVRRLRRHELWIDRYT